MKIILLKSDKKLGKENDIIEVADSYARSVLIPKKIAEEATKENLNKLAGRISKLKYNREQAITNAYVTKSKIEHLYVIHIPAKSSANGKMFGSVTNADIAKKLTEFEINVDKKNISMPFAIKDFGDFPVKIKLFEDISATLHVNVKEEE